MLEFTFANYYHRLKKYSEATLHLLKANQLKLSLDPPDLNNHLELTKQIVKLEVKSVKYKLTDGSGRIFIVGPLRCGSTLLETVLSTNSNIRDLGESEVPKLRLIVKNNNPSLSDIKRKCPTSR